MAKTQERTYEPDEPREFEWSGVQMFRCPIDRCGWSHEDRDAVVDHINESGHLGPDAVEEPTTTDEQPPDESGRKGGKS